MTLAFNVGSLSDLALQAVNAAICRLSSGSESADIETELLQWLEGPDEARCPERCHALLNLGPGDNRDFHCVTCHDFLSTLISFIDDELRPLGGLHLALARSPLDSAPKNAAETSRGSNGKDRQQNQVASGRKPAARCDRSYQLSDAQEFPELRASQIKDKAADRIHGTVTRRRVTPTQVKAPSTQTAEGGSQNAPASKLQQSSWPRSQAVPLPEGKTAADGRGSNSDRKSPWGKSRQSEGSDDVAGSAVADAAAARPASEAEEGEGQGRRKQDTSALKSYGAGSDGGVRPLELLERAAALPERGHRLAGLHAFLLVSGRMPQRHAALAAVVKLLCIRPSLGHPKAAGECCVPSGRAAGEYACIVLQKCIPMLGRLPLATLTALIDAPHLCMQQHAELRQSLLRVKQRVAEELQGAGEPEAGGDGEPSGAWMRLDADEVISDVTWVGEARTQPQPRPRSGQQKILDRLKAVLMSAADVLRTSMSVSAASASAHGMFATLPADQIQYMHRLVRREVPLLLTEVSPANVQQLAAAFVRYVMRAARTGEAMLDEQLGQYAQKNPDKMLQLAGRFHSKSHGPRVVANAAASDAASGFAPHTPTASRSPASRRAFGTAEGMPLPLPLAAAAAHAAGGPPPPEPMAATGSDGRRGRSSAVLKAAATSSGAVPGAAARDALPALPQRRMMELQALLSCFPPALQMYVLFLDAADSFQLQTAIMACMLQSLRSLLDSWQLPAAATALPGLLWQAPHSQHNAAELGSGPAAAAPWQPLQEEEACTPPQLRQQQARLLPAACALAQMLAYMLPSVAPLTPAAPLLAAASSQLNGEVGGRGAREDALGLEAALEASLCSGTLLLDLPWMERYLALQHPASSPESNAPPCSSRGSTATAGTVPAPVLARVRLRLQAMYRAVQQASSAASPASWLLCSRLEACLLHLCPTFSSLSAAQAAQPPDAQLAAGVGRSLLRARGLAQQRWFVRLCCPGLDEVQHALAAAWWLPGHLIAAPAALPPPPPHRAAPEHSEAGGAEASAALAQPRLARVMRPTAMPSAADLPAGVRAVLERRRDGHRDKLTRAFIQAYSSPAPSPHLRTPLSEVLLFVNNTLHRHAILAARQSVAQWAARHADLLFSWTLGGDGPLHAPGRPAASAASPEPGGSACDPASAAAGEVAEARLLEPELAESLRERLQELTLQQGNATEEATTQLLTQHAWSLSLAAVHDFAKARVAPALRALVPPDLGGEVLATAVALVQEEVVQASLKGVVDSVPELVQAEVVEAARRWQHHASGKQPAADAADGSDTDGAEIGDGSGEIAEEERESAVGDADAVARALVAALLACFKKGHAAAARPDGKVKVSVRRMQRLLLRLRCAAMACTDRLQAADAHIHQADHPALCSRLQQPGSQSEHSMPPIAQPGSITSRQLAAQASPLAGRCAARLVQLAGTGGLRLAALESLLTKLLEAAFGSDSSLLAMAGAAAQATPAPAPSLRQQLLQQVVAAQPPPPPAEAGSPLAFALGASLALQLVCKVLAGIVEVPAVAAPCPGGSAPESSTTSSWPVLEGQHGVDGALPLVRVVELLYRQCNRAAQFAPLLLDSTTLTALRVSWQRASLQRNWVMGRWD